MIPARAGGASVSGGPGEPDAAGVRPHALRSLYVARRDWMVPLPHPRQLPRGIRAVPFGEISGIPLAIPGSTRMPLRYPFALCVPDED
jgi:hypothetical protein